MASRSRWPDEDILWGERSEVHVIQKRDSWMTVKSDSQRFALYTKSLVLSQPETKGTGGI